MAASSAVLANRALAHLGQRGRIVTLATDETPEGIYCAQWYDVVVQETLQAAPWPFAKRQTALTLVGENTDGDGFSGIREWTYRYRMPEDCVTPRRVLWSGNRAPNRWQEVPFEEMEDTASTDWSALTTYAVGDYARLASTGVWYRCILATTNNTPPNATYWTAVDRAPRLVFTDVADAYLEYTSAVTDPTRFSLGFEQAVAAKLAFYVASNLTVSEGLSSAQAKVAGLYDGLVADAIAHDLAARTDDLQPASTYQTARSVGVRRGP